MDETPPCKVCGGTDLNLVDGYYYCTECGTQDVTVRETIIEYQVREDGTFAHKQSKKITLPSNKKDLSPEWYKWHAYNFMMAGFADELVALGAGEQFKQRLLWIWSKYVRAYKKEDKSRIAEDVESHVAESISDFNDPTDVHLDGPDKQKRYRINKLVMTIMQAMLYAALNVSESEIQVGDLRRFIKEERVSCRNCLRFIPDDFNFRKMDPLDRCLTTAPKIANTDVLRGYTMTLFKKLNLGFPPAANLLKLVSRYMTELCLPSDFKDLVFSVMRFIPVSLEMEFLEEVPRTPNYEGVAMAYIVIGLKICFGLDDTYEFALSNAVAKYNETHGFGKAYRGGIFIDGTDRLFSFKEWSVYMEFKRQVISKYYFPLAVYCNADIDSQIFVSYTKDRARKNHAAIDTGDDIMMEILGKLNADVESFKTPKIIFPPSLTPMVTYTDVLLSKLQNLELKELLGEDFSQYSLKYVMGNMEFDEIDLSGVSLDNVVISDETMQKRILNWKVDRNIVYIRNCENDNWLLTKPPTEEHVKTIDCVFDNSTNEEAFSNEDLQKEYEGTCNINRDDYKSNVVMNDDVDNIFDDDFYVPEKELWNEYQNDGMEETKDFQINEKESTHINYDLIEDNHGLLDKSTFDEETFDRTAAIEKLLEVARKEYKITDPSTKIPYKRKIGELTDTTKVKKPRTETPKDPNRTKRGEAKKHVENIVNTYYTTIFNRKQYSVDIEPESEFENEDLPELLNNEIEENMPEQPHEENVESNVEDLVLDIDKQNEENIDNEKDVEDEEDTEKVEDITEDPAKKLFDSNLYDTSQLYLKIKDNLETIDETREDTEIIELFRRKERQLESGKNESESEKSEPESEKNNLNQTVNDASNDDNTAMKEDGANDSENTDDDIDSDNIPLSELFKEMDSSSSVNSFLNRENFRPYNYWTLHYCRGYPPESFEKELNRRYSKSFAWTLRLCASVIESTTRVLYLQVINLENELKRRLRKRSIN